MLWHGRGLVGWDTSSEGGFPAHPCWCRSQLHSQEIPSTVLHDRYSMKLHSNLTLFLLAKQAVLKTKQLTLTSLFRVFILILGLGSLWELSSLSRNTVIVGRKTLNGLIGSLFTISSLGVSRRGGQRTHPWWCSTFRKDLTSEKEGGECMTQLFRSGFEG